MDAVTVDESTTRAILKRMKQDIDIEWNLFASQLYSISKNLQLMRFDTNAYQKTGCSSLFSAIGAFPTENPFTLTSFARSHYRIAQI